MCRSGWVWNPQGQGLLLVGGSQQVLHSGLSQKDNISEYISNFCALCMQDRETVNQLFFHMIHHIYEVIFLAGAGT